ncbi:MAG: 16S rRNA (cytosine(1402)-N(4))-methyltransferase RsmH [Patescibacteria group bacterium]
MHIPVLLKESIEILNPQKSEFFIDATIGGGGHSEEILKKIGASGKLLGIDWDKDAIERLKKKFKDCKNAILVNANYADLPEILKENKLPKAKGLIIDLGFSSEQLEKSGKGFSFLRDEPLIMTYRTDKSNWPNKFDNSYLTAAEVVNQFSEKELAALFWKYGEERYSRQIAKRIVEERKKKRILTTFDLVEAINKSYRTNRTYKLHPPHKFMRGMHPATKVFQALRIYVNAELDNLEKLLKNLTAVLKSDGRAVIISFHSLEDRLVKNYFRQMVKEGEAEFLVKKPIRPAREEISKNPRARSAKLRAIKIK